MGRLFGTDGVRGIFGEDLTNELAYKLGMAGTRVLSAEKENPTLIIGMDTRESGPQLAKAMADGIIRVGGNVIDCGVVPTPAIAYLVKHYGADAGVVISASHNPYEYNGIKFFSGEGFKLDDALEDKIEVLLGDEPEKIEGGRQLEATEDPTEAYVAHLIEQANGLSLDGIKIVLDCANGASYKEAIMTYERLGATVVAIGVNPDGKNINLECGSTHTKALQEAVVKEGAFMGLAFDGDADRLIAVDEKGNIIDGDRIMCICARQLMREGKLVDNKLTVTVMSNLGLHRFIHSIGGLIDITKVGDRYVLESMLETGCVLGGEQSGHMIFLDSATTGDGTLSSIKLMGAVLALGKKASEIAEEITIYPQVLHNAKVDKDYILAYKTDREITELIDRITEEMAGEGRVLIRPSGTEPLVRVMIEGSDIDKITALAAEVAGLIESKYGVK